jgi:hypothetical protein
MTDLDLTGIDALPSGSFRLRLMYRGQSISGTHCRERRARRSDA